VCVCDDDGVEAVRLALFVTFVQNLGMLMDPRPCGVGLRRPSGLKKVCRQNLIPVFFKL
jgi:hypothetical protein